MTEQLADVQFSLEAAARYLGEMNRQDKFDQWASYLLESLEEAMGIDALTAIHALLHSRFHNGGW